VQLFRESSDPHIRKGGVNTPPTKDDHHLKLKGEIHTQPSDFKFFTGFKGEVQESGIVKAGWLNDRRGKSVA
jgi:hypothetical protein